MIVNREMTAMAASSRKLLRMSALLAGLCVAGAFARFTLSASPTGDVTVYTDALGAGWQNWSWSSTVDLASTNPVHTGTDAIAVTFTAAWAGVYLHVSPALDGTQFESLVFWIHGGTAGGQQMRVVLYDGSGNAATPVTVTPPGAGQWTQVNVSIASLGAPAQISGIVWQDTTGGAQPTFSLDDITLVAWAVPPTPTPTPSPTAGPALSVNATAARHAISPDVYGMNFADASFAAEIHLPVDRWGGNSTSRYNWQIDTSNTGSDWYFENIAQSVGAADAFVAQDRSTATRTLMTMPMNGWVAKRRLDNHPYDCGFKVSKYGAQQSTDPWDPDCGNGVDTGGSDITGNDPTDTSISISPDFDAAWIAHFISLYGSAAQGGVAYYDLDNEPMLWDSTHRDVHPSPTSYDEMRDRTLALAAAIKAADPTAKTLGPAEWGWTGYFWSALDWAPGGDWWNHPQDRLAHGDVPFVEWYLQQMAAYDQANGQRILDYCDEHFYPPSVALTGAGDAALQALRLRSTRLLWDTTYTEETWIGQPVYLLPRMQAWVDDNYPGTKRAVSEYNWGALDSINGALAQADVLGIFGREGLDLATLWGPPTSTQPGAFAFRMYRIADNGKGFGENSVQATSADQGQLSVYAAERAADGALTVMVINKTAIPLTSALSLSGFVPASLAHVYRYSAANPAAIVTEPDEAVSASGLTTTFPDNSITLLVIPPGSADLAVTLAGTPDPVVAGSPLTYAATVRNDGPATATGVTLVDVLPAGVGFSSASAGCTNAAGTVTCALGALASGASASVSVVITAAATGQVSNTVTVSADQPDPNAANNTATITTSVGPTQPAGVSVDMSAGAGSTGDLNGVLEPGEAVAVAPSWLNPGGAPLALTGSVTAFAGPQGAAYTIVDGAADYGTIGAGATASCVATGDCYVLGVSNPATRPVTHWDVSFTETLSTGQAITRSLHIGNSFTDVPPSRWAYGFIETLLHSGITAGCGDGVFCPADPVSRWQMAVFLAKAKTGGSVPVSGTVPGMGDYNCVAGGSSVFGDVSPDDPGCKFIHYVAAQQITVGCGSGDYCPSTIVSRWQMGVFLAKAIATGAIPSSGTVPGMGDYDCVAGGSSVFGDVSPDDSGCKFIHYVAAQQITVGCGGGDYCPSTDVTRDQMAVFITKAFALRLYGP